MDDYPPKSGLLFEYKHLRGMSECMPIIRKILGLPAYGQIPATTALGRALQKFVENDSKGNMC